MAPQNLKSSAGILFEDQGMGIERSGIDHINRSNDLSVWGIFRQRALAETKVDGGLGIWRLYGEEKSRIPLVDSIAGNHRDWNRARIQRRNGQCDHPWIGKVNGARRQKRRHRMHRSQGNSRRRGIGIIDDQRDVKTCTRRNQLGRDRTQDRRQSLVDRMSDRLPLGIDINGIRNTGSQGMGSFIPGEFQCRPISQKSTRRRARENALNRSDRSIKQGENMEGFRRVSTNDQGRSGKNLSIHQRPRQLRTGDPRWQGHLKLLNRVSRSSRKRSIDHFQCSWPYGPELSHLKCHGVRMHWQGEGKTAPDSPSEDLEQIGHEIRSIKDPLPRWWFHPF